MNDPHLWWYVSRASAMIAWALLTTSVLWGILLSTRVMRRVDNPAWLQDLHGYLGGTSLVMVGLHMVSLMIDSWLSFTVAEVLVPFATAFKPLPVALGILAFYLLVAVQGSSLMLKRLPRKFWKGLHYASYATLLLVSFHAGFTGTDVGSLWYRIVSIALILLAALAVILRIIAGKRSGSARQADAAPGGAPVQPVPRTMVVASATGLAHGIVGIRLKLPDGGMLPVWQPGSHVTLHLPNGLQKQYSLCGDPANRNQYDVAVLRTSQSSGGSSWIHENLVPGMSLPVSGPMNHFELEPAADYLFIAGGIGITPITAMIQSLPAGRAWRLVYAGRSRQTMAFVAELEAEYPQRMIVHASDENVGGLDLDVILGTVTAQVYCCGPESLMNAVAARVPAGRLHLERFVPLERSARPAAPIQVACRKSRLDFTVPAEESLLDALESHGVPILGSCRKGICGTCEVRVVEGTPEHLDSVLDDAEKDALGVMYPCVSRSLSASLVLNI
ncbi:2Fe-2S iron-sulfur cluster binding domain-containing protein [Cryobacterium sp. TMT1-3]|uniref:2Fe-2S iron-sulfur cluster binding domain-containing protein n=1 Tax=Cryobacterium luteum TaxID=1424661 RepID=A0A1H8ARA1_9MICO|nr:MULTISPECIES: 2Fe-2S iron-sulfur cluster-binding protein [Cryobacterium]TFB88575.1 2Fe-2S iron-sulfur cluster binding domain-containing protein [Cryobacterium luteum]TFC24603.1 2Fe-2S iron-sulfur cluster binding domain-containing protein [Cryobacterium sp. TMT1-3]SEM72037.1 Ferredoxin-NADP reductase [Cryobacterium luteum]